jgi:hypothetical protein
VAAPALVVATPAVGTVMTSPASPRRPPVFGPEPWSTVAGQSWCHWDLWYCLAAQLDHDGDLARLEAIFVAALKDPLWGRDCAEAKLSHLVDLRARLSTAGLSPAELIPPEDLTDKALVSKTRRKVSDRGLEGRAMTPAMVETPRRGGGPHHQGPESLGSSPAGGTIAGARSCRAR